MKWVDSMKNNNKKGFTLIELITVIIIIGTLATLLVPTIMNYVKKARVKAAIADARTIKAAIEYALIDHFMNGAGDTTVALNKVLYLDQNTKKGLDDREHEIVGAFTNYSWCLYRQNPNAKNLTGSQSIDYVIAGALNNAVSEEWKTGTKTNPMSYNTKSKNCRKYLKDQNTNFGLVVVYNSAGVVRLLQIFRKDVLVTYIDGEYVANTSSDAHFVGTGTWDTIYKDSGKSSPVEFCKVNLSNKQIGSNGNLGGWY